MSSGGLGGPGAKMKRAKKRSDAGIFLVLTTCDGCPTAQNYKDESGWRKCKAINCESCVIDQRAQIASWACPQGHFEAEKE